MAKSSTDLAAALRRSFFRTGLYHRMLQGPAPSRFLHLSSTTPWGDPARGNALFQGRYHFAGAAVTMPNQPPWRLRAEDAAWMAGLHDFTWLSDFAAVGGLAAAGHARKLIRSWSDLCSTYDHYIWDTAVAARRLSAWILHAGFLLRPSDDGFKDSYMTALGWQIRHLRKAVKLARDPDAGLDVALALCHAGLALADQGDCLRHGMALLPSAITTAVSSDGGHYSRCPSLHMDRLESLKTVAALFHQAAVEPPALLHHYIQRMSEVLRLLRHGDGALALFNGGFEESPARIAHILDEPDGAPEEDHLWSTSEMGFQMLSAGPTRLIVDVGVAGGSSRDRRRDGSRAEPPLNHRHAGLLSFELSVAAARLVVNCGSGRAQGGEWRAAAQRGPAHSILSLAGREAVEIDDDGRISHRPGGVKCRRREDDHNAMWLETSHDGFVSTLGLVHHRRFFLTKDGTDIRGEDTLLAAGKARQTGPLDIAGHPFTVRFHLHPDVKASLLSGGGAVLLRLPDGQGWRFRADGAAVTVEDSVYLGRRGAMRRAEQMVLRGHTGSEGARIRWAFQKS